jgi:hypothetical protein
MKRRYILYRRKRGGMFYIEDTETRKQESTGTRNRAEATSLLNARNESIRQPQLNLQIAKAYLAGTDSGVSKRTWQDAFNAITENKHGSTQERWQRAVKQKAFDLILPLIIIEMRIPMISDTCSNPYRTPFRACRTVVGAKRRSEGVIKGCPTGVKVWPSLPC